MAELPLTDGQLVRLAEVIGCDVSEEMMKVAQAHSPHMGTLAHALGLAWAARVAVSNLLASFAGHPEEADARAHLTRLVGLTNASADTAVALAHAREAQNGSVPVG